MRFIGKRFNKIKGFSLLESIIAGGILSGIAIFSVSSTKMINQKISVVQRKSLVYEMTDKITQEVTSHVKNYQIDYSGSDPLVSLGNSHLKMVWDTVEGVFDSSSDCIRCRGKLGVVIQPVTGSKGLYLASIKFVHPELPNPILISSLAKE